MSVLKDGMGVSGAAVRSWLCCMCYLFRLDTLHCSVSLNHCLSPGVFIPRPSQSVCPCGDLETELRCAVCKQGRKSRDCPITRDNLHQQAVLLQREVWLPLNSSEASLPCKARGRLFLPGAGTAGRVCAEQGLYLGQVAKPVCRAGPAS